MMNRASRWRLAMAERIAPVYIENPAVQAVVVSGSVSRGCADLYSDIEIAVFWEDPPTEEMRRQAAERCKAAEWHSYGYNREEWTEDYLIDGVKIDVSHRIVGVVEQWLGDVVDRCDTDVAKQNLASAIQGALPLHGSSRLASWRAKIAVYPDGLADAVVRENLILGPQSWLEILAGRESLIELYSTFCIAQKRLLGILMGLNRVYHPGFKWPWLLVSSFSHAPSDLEARLKRALSGEPISGVHEIGRLADETYALVDTHMPHIETSQAREVLSKLRPIWLHPPSPEIADRKSPEKK